MSLDQSSKQLPHTPFVGAGLNFTWDVLPGREDMGSLSRRLFSVPESTFFQAFDADDARFGTYVSKAAINCRMTLDIKPVKEDREKLRLFFNFHLDVPQNPDDAVPQILQHLARWDDAAREAQAVVDLLNVQ